MSTRRPVPEIVSLLVKFGANVNSRYTPDMNGSGSSDPKERQAAEAFNRTQNQDYSPLYYAARYSNAEMVEHLLRLGADVQSRTSLGKTALFGTHDTAVAKVLINHGLDINARDREGATVLKRTREWFENNRTASEPLRRKAEAYEAFLLANGARE